MPNSDTDNPHTSPHARIILNVVTRNSRLSDAYKEKFVATSAA